MNKESSAYKKAYKAANDKYGTKSSIYRSAYIVKKYKELGGKFSTSKKPSEKGLTRWFKGEQWIRVVPYLTTGEILPCGSTGYKTFACRPLKRANANTPITIAELLKVHGKNKILKAARLKESDPNKRLIWKTLRVN